MKSVASVVIAALALAAGPAPAQEPLGSGFLYQGRLKQHGAPFTGVVDLSFDLVAAESGGTSLGSQAILDVAVADGLFVVELNAGGEFGADAFRGEARWLEVAVNGSTLTPRQKLAAAPYALHSDSTRGLAVDAEGRVGIGTATPASELTVAGTVESTAGGVKFPDGTVQVSAAPDGPGLWATDGVHVFAANSGNVGVGTSAPQSTFEVSGSLNAQTVEIVGGTNHSQPFAAWAKPGLDSDAMLNGPFEALIEIDAGDTAVVGIRPDGTLVAWGSHISEIVPNVPEGTFTAVSVSDIAVAIRTDGTLACWPSEHPTCAETPAGQFQAVSVANHVNAIRTDGTVACWPSELPVCQAVPSGQFVAAAAGYLFTVGIRDDGSLAAWGEDQGGRLDVPAGQYVDVAAGSQGVAIRSDGRLVLWGGAGFVPDGEFVTVDLERGQAVAINSGGSLYSWQPGAYEVDPVPSGVFLKAAAHGLEGGFAIRAETSGVPALFLHQDAAYKPGSSSWTTMSDRRLKTRINPLDDALAKFLTLQGHTYHWRDPATQGNHYGPQMGLIADEVAEVFPSWIGRNMDGFQTLTVSGFEALTVEAVRELRREKDEQIEQQCDEIAALRERLERLEAALAAPPANGEAVAP
jgi:hypothetical protein